MEVQVAQLLALGSSQAWEVGDSWVVINHPRLPWGPLSTLPLCPLAHLTGLILQSAFLFLVLGPFGLVFKFGCLQMPAVCRIFPKSLNIFRKMECLSPKLTAKY